jgi:hypothetical protein
MTTEKKNLKARINYKVKTGVKKRCVGFTKCNTILNFRQLTFPSLFGAHELIKQLSINFLVFTHH